MAVASKKGSDETISPIPPKVEAAGPAPEEKAPPPHGTPKPAGTGDVPRIVDQLVRAPAGLTRYKIRCDNYDSRFKTARYILAEDETQAREFFTVASGLDEHRERLKTDGIETQPPRLIVSRLAD